MPATPPPIPLNHTELRQLSEGIQQWIVKLSQYLDTSVAAKSLPVLGDLAKFVATEKGELTKFGKTLSDAISKAIGSNKVPTQSEVSGIINSAFKTAGIPFTFQLTGDSNALSFSFDAKMTGTYTQSLAGEIGLGSVLNLKSGGAFKGSAGFELKFSGGVDSLGYFADTNSNRSSLNLFTKDDLSGIQASGLAGGLLNANVKFAKASSLEAGINLAVGTSDSLAGGIIRSNALESLTINPALSGNLNLDLGVALSLQKTSGNKTFNLLPLNSQEIVHWNFATQSSPDIQLKNTTLALGSVFESGGLLANILSSVANIAGKIDPLIQGLTKDIPGISNSSFIDFATSSKDLTDQQKQDATDFVTLLQQAATFLKDIPKIDPAATLRLPNYAITGVAAPTLAYVPPTGSENDPVATEVTTALPIIPKTVSDFLSKVSLGSFGTLSIPLLSDPSTLARLLIGQEVDLLSWNLPTIDKSFTSSIEPFAPVPAIPVSLAAGISANFKENLGIGYDSRGILAYQASGKESALLDGIYVYDSTGQNGSPLHADFTFSPSVSAGLGGAIGATVSGSVRLAADVHLQVDSLGTSHPFINGALVDNIDSPLSATAKLSGQLLADLEIGPFSKQVEILSNSVLWDYNFPKNAPLYGPATVLTDGNLRINVGDYESISGNYENPAGGDTLIISRKSGKIGAESLGIAANTEPFTTYKASKKIVGSISSGTLTIIEKNGVLTPLEFAGGNSNLTYVGGAGNDTLRMGDGNNTITPSTGTKNYIEVGSGTNLIHLGLGAASVSGGNGTTVAFDKVAKKPVYADLSTGSLTGGALGSHITGVPNMIGSTLGDTLIGGGSAGTLVGGRGSDFLISGSLISGASGETLVGASPGSNFPGRREIDTLKGGTGNDLFVLGDNASVYYLSGSTRGGGKGDYALINNFDPTSDQLQLKGSASLYSASGLTVFGQQGLGIYYDPLGAGAKSELISIIQPDSTHTLADLNMANTVQLAQFV